MTINRLRPKLEPHEINPPMPSVLDVKLIGLRDLALALARYIEKLQQESSFDSDNRSNLALLARRREISLIKQVLLLTEGNQHRAAKFLGMKVTTLNMKIKRYDLGSEKCQS